MKFDVNITVNVYNRPAPEVLAAIADVLAAVQSFEGRTMDAAEKIKEELDLLKSEVTESKTVMQGATVLLTGMAQKLRDLAAAATSVDALKGEVLALAESLDADQTGLAEAIEAGTVAVSET